MQNILAIALTTFRESARSKVLYVALFFAAGLVAVSALFGTVTIGDQIHVVKDFGLFAASLFPIGYAIIGGSALLANELSKKTVYNILSKSVYRSEFILGKFLGMFTTSAMMLAIMGASLSLFTYCIEGTFDRLLLLAYFYSLLELAIISAAAIFFSSIVVTPLLSGIFTFGLFLAGRSADYFLYFVREGEAGPAVGRVLKSLYWITPHLNELYIGNDVIYGRMPSSEHTLCAALYVFGYVGVLIVAAQFIFRKKEFN